jgi:hypothetical protein
VPSEVTNRLSRIGRRGGRSKSAVKLAAIRANLKKAQAARRKYPRRPDTKTVAIDFRLRPDHVPADPLDLYPEIDRRDSRFYLRQCTVREMRRRWSEHVGWGESTCLVSRRSVRVFGSPDNLSLSNCKT